jgi:diguanylate cyclase (GGDEF)-like protein
VKKPLTLFAALRHANLGIALICMITAGLALGILTFFSLRTQVNTNLKLVARTIAYSTEAALMFNDKLTAYEILQQIARQENLEQAAITTHTGEVFAHVEQADAGNSLHRAINQLVFPSATTTPITSMNQTLGLVTIRGNSTIFIAFFIKMVSVIIVSLFLAGFITLSFTRRMERKITSQLDTLAKNTLMRHTLRSQEESGLQIAEFQQINTQFRNLLAELDARNTELTLRQANLENTNAFLDYQANHDELTELVNRAYFNNRLNQAIECARKDGSHLAVLYLDSDHFKAINDQYGHTVGDMYLIKTAQSIRQAVRRSDIVARLGGDEFAVLLAPLEAPTIARRAAEKILETPEIAILNDGRELVFALDISIGIAIFPDMAHDSDSLLMAADHAMYIAKRAGGRRYHIASRQDVPVESSPVS